MRSRNVVPRRPWADDATNIHPEPAVVVGFVQLRDSYGALCTGCGKRYPERDVHDASHHAEGRCMDLANDSYYDTGS